MAFSIVSVGDRSVFQCDCGCQDTQLIKRSYNQSTWKFAPIIEREFLICSSCGAEEERGKAPVKMGSQNFPARNKPWDQWICACEKKVTYVNNLKSCPKCGKECLQGFKQEMPYQPNKAHH